MSIKQNDEPPLEWIHPERAMAIWIVSVILILVASVLFLIFARVPEEKKEVSLSRCFLEAHILSETDLSFVDSSIPAQAPPYIVEGEVLAILIEKEETLIEKIIRCESKGDPTAKNPNSTARGLLQIIKSSEEFCEEGMGRELDMYNPDDNLLCGEYLMEHGGLNHWNASRHCWDK